MRSHKSMVNIQKRGDSRQISLSAGIFFIIINYQLSIKKFCHLQNFLYLCVLKTTTMEEDFLFAMINQDIHEGLESSSDDNSEDPVGEG